MCVNTREPFFPFILQICRTYLRSILALVHVYASSCEAPEDSCLCNSLSCAYTSRILIFYTLISNVSAIKATTGVAYLSPGPD